MSKHSLKLAEKIILALLLALAAYIVFYKLGSFPLENWDEAWYGDIIRNMLRQKDLIVLHWNRMPLIDKPPFFMWIGAALSSIIGLSEFSIRLPSALSALAAIAIVTIYSYRQYGFVPSLLAFSAIAFNNVFIWRARTGNIDALVSLQIFLTYFLILSKNKFRYLLLGILFAMIYLTKASLVFFPLVIFALYELFLKFVILRKTFLVT
ncbi:MAG: ArnT family glycosyltransferase [Patescibacteria group bacterium]